MKGIPVGAFSWDADKGNATKHKERSAVCRANRPLLLCFLEDNRVLVA